MLKYTRCVDENGVCIACLVLLSCSIELLGALIILHSKWCKPLIWIEADYFGLSQNVFERKLRLIVNIDVFTQTVQ